MKLAAFQARYLRALGGEKRRDAVALAVILAVLLMIALASCSSPDETTIKPSASAIVPPAQQVCPDGTSPPKSPKPPRTIPQITEWGVGVFDAWYKTELARQECARRLTRLNQWVEDHLAEIPVPR